MLELIAIVVASRDTEQKEHDDQADSTDNSVRPAEEVIFAANPRSCCENEKLSAAKSVNWIVVISQQLVISRLKISSVILNFSIKFSESRKRGSSHPNDKIFISETNSARARKVPVCQIVICCSKIVNISSPVHRLYSTVQEIRIASFFVRVEFLTLVGTPCNIFASHSDRIKSRSIIRVDDVLWLKSETVNSGITASSNEKGVVEKRVCDCSARRDWNFSVKIVRTAVVIWFFADPRFFG